MLRKTITRPAEDKTEVVRQALAFLDRNPIPNGRPDEDPVRRATLESSMDVDRGLVAARSRAHAEAQGEHAKAAAGLAAAKAKYFETGLEPDLDILVRAEKRFERAEHCLGAHSEALAQVTASLEANEAELAKIKTKAAKAPLRERASLRRFYTTCIPHWAAILAAVERRESVRDRMLQGDEEAYRACDEAEQEIRTAQRGVEREYAASVAAAKQIGDEPLGKHHRLAGIVLALVQAEPSRAIGYLASWHLLAEMFEAPLNFENGFGALTDRGMSGADEPRRIARARELLANQFRS